MIFMCLTKLISMRRLSQPFKDSLPKGRGLPTGEEKGGFRLKQGYTDLIYLSRLLLCLFYKEGLIQALVPIE